MKVSFLDQKLGALLDADVNEEEPNILTAWVSALTVTPKQDGDIQVCVDMSRANEAIVCEQHHIPTIKEILHDLHASIVFSNLDLSFSLFESAHL